MLHGYSRADHQLREFPLFVFWSRDPRQANPVGRQSASGRITVLSLPRSSSSPEVVNSHFALLSSTIRSKRRYLLLSLLSYGEAMLLFSERLVMRANLITRRSSRLLLHRSGGINELVPVWRRWHTLSDALPLKWDLSGTRGLCIPLFPQEVVQSNTGTVVARTYLSSREAVA